MYADIIRINYDLWDNVDVLFLNVEELRICDLLDMGGPREDHILLSDYFIGEDAKVFDGLLDDAAYGFAVVLEQLVEDYVVLDDDLGAEFVVVG